MTDVISIDTSKGLNMTEEEKEAFVQCMDMNYDYGLYDFITEEEHCLYQAIMKERREKIKRGEYV